MNDALFNLALAAVGLPAVVGGVALVAHTLVERHANATADTIRRQHPQPIPAQTRPRQKELVR